MTHDWQQQIHALHDELIRRDDPAAWVREADAVDASVRYPGFALRGPVFGVAAQEPAVGPEWRVLKPVVHGMPQMCRDSLNSHLWFRAKDDTDDPAVRRELLAAVDVLEREPVNEVEACGVRYRIVRGDEFTRCDGSDRLEPPRPTDPEPTVRTWERRAGHTPSPDLDLVLDPGPGDDGPMAGALRAGLRGFVYRGVRFPAEVRRDSERAVRSHPGIVLLPVCFGVVERERTGWEPALALQSTPHDARRALHDAMVELWPLLYQYDDEKKAVYEKAAEEFRALERADEARVAGRTLRVCRVERMLRMGPDGPEPPRPSDVDEYGPMKIHPKLLDDGTVVHEE
ncbi:hypothetical protein EJ357_36530 [Streptomyces cyaneochromogenes]|uniref:Aromatic ring-opening dioxygenase LigA n=1 Tax=Streptomyces cyaneochromogenes TaxID=2496836 RepID=A0A3Q9EY24_9ACTN|nr:DUF5954 family protein [Streptomyces cyaneochromogenes]AZQ38289.1 hypothetical protein EJ357_36530 [Streptomyces cyaneochromogenes]